MPWSALLSPAAPWAGTCATATGAAGRADAARACFATTLGRLRTIEAEQEPDTPSFLDVLLAFVGPAEVAATWREWRAEHDEPDGALDRLEARIERAQRDVSRVARWIDGAVAGERAVAEEISALRADVAVTSGNLAAVEERARKLRAGLDAIDLARTRADPVRGAALDADAALLTAYERDATRDARHFRAVLDRLDALLEAGADTLATCGRLRSALERVHDDGVAVLADLDRHVSRLAAEARAADLGETLAPAMADLRASVGRVHLLAREGTDRLQHRLDRLAEAPDLLAPDDPARRAAEAEVAELAVRRG